MTTTVLGAGYAGIMAANRLAGSGHEVTLVTPHPWFVERIRLHRVACGLRPDARIDLASLLHPAVTVITETATRIDAREVQLAGGTRLPFETLIYAVGSGASSSNGAYRIVSEQEAMRLQVALTEAPTVPVTIIGGGATGVELAGALREAGRAVTLITATAPTRNAELAHHRHLIRQGVQIETGRRIDPGTVTGEIVVDATGFTVPTLAATSSLPVDPHGRLLVDERLTVPGHPHMLGAGDAVAVTSDSCRHLRAACATALPMGAHAADVIIARSQGRDAEPFGMGYLLQCVDLGARRGHIQIVHADDTERAMAIGGIAGGMIKEAICRMTIRWLQQERNRAGSHSWPAPPASTSTSNARSLA